MTPAEMADWLDDLAEQNEKNARVVSNTGMPARDNEFGRDAQVQRAIAKWIRRQPTDAQKIEALRAASTAGAYGERAHEAFTVFTHDDLHAIYAIRGGSPDDITENSYASAHHANVAMRLLGLTPED